ncbi:hypothetical protein BCY84_11290 [Trypanosoma cruzi cruzi]|uniref:Hook complex protein, conserved n=1 Tax=Trypanosoma cruzi TaxID=5693 RepID=A0A2V2VMQ1_TRYCR|nr:hypothetical protein BCY84_11290 [Trypanosoma cruzi cruzi]PWU97717.1 hook complex protein, conserved [Trypanosoma cruzi]
MISLNFTLYRLVCDVTTYTGLFAPDSEGRRIQDTSAFVCCWCRVPRQRSATFIEPSGCTPEAFFKSQGSDMVLSFHSATGSIEIDSDTEVIAFKMKPVSYVGGPAPVVAKGTLDPLPYIGKPAKNYAIKLREAAGQVIGKLLFALEAREPEPENKGVPAKELRLRGIKRAASINKSKSPPDSKQSADTQKHLLPQHRHYDTGNVNAFQGQIQAHKQEVISLSPPSSAGTRRNSSALLHDRHDNRRNTATLADVPIISQSCTPESRYMEIVIEKIAVKNEAINLDNPAPLLLGGIYYLKARYGGITSSTPSVQCQSPREIKYSHRVKFLEVPGKSEKLRFSLWEDDRQVAGFSLDPVKFSVPPGVWKEYSIPFRYYPTQQAISLEVAVRRVKAAEEKLVKKKEENEEKIDVSIVKNGTPSSEAKEPPTQPTSEVTKVAEQKSESFHTVLGTQDGIPASSSGFPPAEPMSYQRINSARGYVQKGYLDSNVRQSHWRNAVPQDDKDNSREGPTPLGPQPIQRDRSLGDADAYTPYSTSENDQRGLRVRAGEAATKGRTERDGEMNSDNRMRSFLDQIASSDLRSFSATRQAAQGMELPRASLSHRSIASNRMENDGNLRRDERDATPLRNRFFYTASPNRKEERLLSACGTSGSSTRERFLQMRSKSLNANSDGPRSDVASLSDITNGFERKAHSLNIRGGTFTTPHPSLMKEWLEWREQRASAQVSRAGSVHSAFSRNDSVDSIASRNRAVSPLPTKSFAHLSEQRPYQPQYVRRSLSRNSATNGRPPLPIR